MLTRGGAWVLDAWSQLREQPWAWVGALVGVAYVGFSLLLGLMIALVLFISLSVLAPDLSALDPDPAAMGLGEMGRLGPLMLALVLLSLLQGVPLMMAILFAPALVAIDSVPVGRALGLSLQGCWRNLLPLLVFSLVALGLGIATLS